MTAGKVVRLPRRRAAEAAPVYKLRAMQRVVKRHLEHLSATTSDRCPRVRPKC